jgi:hypothetical protein
MTTSPSLGSNRWKVDGRTDFGLAKTRMRESQIKNLR